MAGTMKPSPHLLAGARILQIVPALDAGGAEQTTLEVARALAAAGAEAIVATSGGRLVEAIEAAGGRVIRFPAAAKNPATILRNASRLRALIEHHQVDLVHARSRAPAWSAYLATRRPRLPFVTTYHGAYRSRGRLKTLYNSVMARGDVVIANSRFTAETISARYPFARSQLEVVYRGADLAAFDPDRIPQARLAALRTGWGLAAGRPMVLMPARLTGLKGHNVLVDAAAQLHHAGARHVDFVIAGDTETRRAYAASLIDRILGAGLAASVRLVGHCADMPAAIALADVVVMPSTGAEGLGRAAIEAQAGGKPAVVSDLGGLAETVLAPPEVDDADRTGWRVPSGDATALAKAIAEALSLTPEDRQSLAARARRHAGARFSLEAMLDATLAIYARLLGRDGAAGSDHEQDPAAQSRPQEAWSTGR